MRGLDTNVLVRYLVWDDKKQAQKAADCIKRIIDSGNSCFINVIVFSELVWVLESAYRYNREEIAEVCEKILMIKQFEIESKDIVRMAVIDYKKGKADLADYLIGKINMHEGCKFTYTFDRTLKKRSEFTLLD
jgi:predicted nucleic-acid-binding protein